VNEMTIIVGSMTYASKAKKALSDVGIRARIVKTDTNYSRGCIYGVTFSNEQFLSAVAELRKQGIQYELIKDR